jgi:ABC-type transporter Mla subunit MlaD
MALQDLTPQLRTRLRRMEQVVGVFVGLAVLVLVCGFIYYVWYTATRKGWFVSKVPYFTVLQSAEGINVGDPITLAGFEVGEVTGIDAEPPGAAFPVFLAFRIRDPYYGYVWSDSKVRITAAELFGRRKIEVMTGREGQPTVLEKDGRVEKMLVGGTYVPFENAPKGAFVPPEETAALSVRAEKLLAQVEAALPGILGLAEDARRVLGNAEQLSIRLTALVREVEPVAANLAAITTRLRDPQGSLGEWLLPPDLRRRLETTLDGSRAAVLRLEETLRNLAAMTASLNTQVQANDQILSEVSALVVQADELISGLKRHWLLRGAFPRGETGAAAPVLMPEIAPAGEP